MHGTRPLQLFNRLGKILDVWPDDDRLGQSGDLHDIRSAHRYQAAADKNDVGQRVELPQLTHRVAEKDRVVTRRLMRLAASHAAESAPGDQSRHVVEPL